MESRLEQELCEEAIEPTMEPAEAIAQYQTKRTPFYLPSK